jgi:hypothetical protein
MRNDINIWTCLYLWAMYLVFDILNARYIICVQNSKPLQGANYSFVLCILTSIGTIEYVKNWLYVIPIAAGLWCGTYITLKYELFKKLRK